MFCRRILISVGHVRKNSVQLLNFLSTRSTSQNVKNVYLIDENNNAPTVDHRLGCNKFTTRSHNCAQLTADDAGQSVTLCGWLEFHRMNKFITLRDGYGHTQLLIKELDTENKTLLKNLTFESILEVNGTVLLRPKNMINKEDATGEIEVLVSSIKVLNPAKSSLPFNVREFQKAKEPLRMQYRYMDLRFAEMQRNMRVRSQFIMDMRNFLINECGFVDVETPTLFGATPGGAQEFIVPTRHAGKFYTLVQSPQQFKQMLMAGAIDRYFQVARCYRDEGSRPDRQPEFTQLDIEMSFTTRDDVLSLIEELLQSSWPESISPLPSAFLRLSYNEAMEKYGTDKPDIRADFQLQNCSPSMSGYDSSFAVVFEKPYASALTDSVKNNLLKLHDAMSNVKFYIIKATDQQHFLAQMSVIVGDAVAANIDSILNIKTPSIVFFAYGDKKIVLPLLGQVRLDYIKAMEDEGLRIWKEGVHPVWITDFPLFEETATGGLQTVHHPFTAPLPDDIRLLESYPLEVKSNAYDLVINGSEIGGGSIRIHDPVLQKSILKLLNIDPRGLRHMLDMLGSGCPPHGGIALGLDRLLSVMLNTQSIRDVIAFPKTFEGRDLISGAPSSITEHDKNLYHIDVLPLKK